MYINVTDNLERIFKCTIKVFNIIAVSETRITKQTTFTTNINLKNYTIELHHTGNLS